MTIKLNSTGNDSIIPYVKLYHCIRFKFYACYSYNVGQRPRYLFVVIDSSCRLGRCFSDLEYVQQANTNLMLTDKLLWNF